MFYRPLMRYAVEAVHKVRPNVVSFQMAMEERIWYIFGCYLTPNNTSRIESVVAALKEQPQGEKLLLAGYLNMKLL